MTAPRATWIGELDRRALILGAIVVVFGYVPLTFLGPGTDLDVGGVYNAGRSILDGDYQVSRVPGAPVFEAATGVLHAAGGSVLVNLGSVIAAVVAALGVSRLLQREGHRHAGWFGLAVLVNPFVWVAGTSMVDFMWAAALVLVGANLQLSRHWMPAAAMYALAAGCRLSTLVVVGALLLADALGSTTDRRKIVVTGGVTAALTAVIYLPPFLQLGIGFMQSDVATSSMLIQIGRFGAKNTFFFGPVMIGLVLWQLPLLLRTVPSRWTSSMVLRFGVFGFVGTQLLFLRFPWKLAHLIPSWICLVLALAAAGVLSRRGIAILIAAQLVLAAVTVNIAQPDQPNEATGGRLTLEVIEGPWLRDLRCRLDGDQDAYRQSGQIAPLLATWSCVIPWSSEHE